ncbi:hypothetical protein WA026_022126, partial [Henosepilachna vigintioctopunctata]
IIVSISQLRTIEHTRCSFRENSGACVALMSFGKEFIPRNHFIILASQVLQIMESISQLGTNGRTRKPEEQILAHA